MTSSPAIVGRGFLDIMRKTAVFSLALHLRRQSVGVFALAKIKKSRFCGEIVRIVGVFGVKVKFFGGPWES